MGKCCIIVDLDGTISDHTHRIELAKQKRYDEYHAACINDPPIKEMVALVKMISSMGVAVVYMTGRTEKHRGLTQDWLDKNCMPYSLLLMRRDEDYRPGAVIKKEYLSMLQRDMDMEVWLVFEDQQSNVDMWREEGLVCLQMPVL